MKTPSMSSLISPKDAMTTPMTIMKTLPRVERFTGATRRAHEASSVAMAVVAYTSQLRLFKTCGVKEL